MELDYRLSRTRVGDENKRLTSITDIKTTIISVTKDTEKPKQRLIPTVDSCYHQILVLRISKTDSHPLNYRLSRWFSSSRFRDPFSLSGLSGTFGVRKSGSLLCEWLRLCFNITPSLSAAYFVLASQTAFSDVYDYLVLLASGSPVREICYSVILSHSFSYFLLFSLFSINSLHMREHSHISD